MNTNNANPADVVMCHCSGTTLGNIQHLFHQGLDMDAISRMTGAISGCGGCEWDILQLLKDFAERQGKRQGNSS
jgi:bacterioferritin-associated ferredoxin